MINYETKDYASLRQEIFDFAKKNYPDVYSDFTDASVGTMFIEFIAFIGDKLFFNLDRTAQEKDVDQAQERKSLLQIAKNNNLNVFGKKAASTLIDFSVTVPPKGNGPDLDYMPLILRGAQSIGAGQSFETTFDSDFSNPLSALGTPNRFIRPNFNSNQVITSYTVTKREIATNGRSKYFSKIITTNDSVPFLKITLPDKDILEITDVITLAGTNFTSLPSLSQLYNPENRWTQVDSLIQKKSYIEMPQMRSDQSGIMVGKLVDTPRRFIIDKTAASFTTLTFGGSSDNSSSIEGYISDSSILLKQLADRSALGAFGLIPSPNTTMYIKYRIGGGRRANVGAGVLTSAGDVNILVSGPNQSINTQVRSSLQLNNPIPAIGGADEYSIEELRHLIKGNNGTKNNAVTIRDYNSLIALMPSKFGAPYKYNVKLEDNKVKVSILTLNADGSLSNVSSSTLKNNIKEFLKSKKMLNDYIEITEGRAINLKVVYYIFAEPQFDKNELASSIINTISSFTSTVNRFMGQDLFISQLNTQIGRLDGVTSIVDYEFFNPIGAQYSKFPVSQLLSDENTRKIDLLSQDVIFCNDNEMLEIKNPSRDIRIKFVN